MLFLKKMGRSVCGPQKVFWVTVWVNKLNPDHLAGSWQHIILNFTDTALKRLLVAGTSTHLHANAKNMEQFQLK